MAKFQIPDNPSFSTLMRKLEVTDPAHADLFNSMFQQLLENDEYNNRTAREHTYVMNPSEEKRYEIGMDENGVYLVESNDNPDTVVLKTKQLDDTDTVAMTVDNKTYGIENASNGKDVPEGGVVFSLIN